MSDSVLFFQPTLLPLTADDLSAETVLSFKEAAPVRERLDALLPELAWDEGHASGTLADGRWLEMTLRSGIDPNDPAAISLSMRCSMRASYDDVIQRLCDAAGWVAFDGRPRLFQPHREPMSIS